MINISINDFLLNYGLYKELKFNIKDYNWLKRLEDSPLQFDAYCPECKKISTFTSGDKTVLKGKAPGHSNFDPNFNLDIETLKNIHQNDYISFINANQEFKRVLNCARNRNHIMIFQFLIKTNSDGEETSILKVGQYPSFVDFNYINLKKYSKIISKILSQKEANEYRKAIMLYNYKYGVGSFIYLRRIFENLVLNTFEENKDNINLEADFYNLRTKEKIMALKDFLPSFLTENKHIYDILSKGIHELKEEECLDIFNIIKESIEFILEDLNAIIEKENKKKQLEKSLNDINTKYE